MHNDACSGLIASCLFALVSITPAKADDIPACAPPNGVSSMSSLNQTPPALLRALKERFVDIVASGEKFDATDVVVTGRNRRLIFIWNMGVRWIVATEHGGFVYNDPIFAYDLGPDGQSATLVQERVAVPSTVCAAALSLLGSGSL